MTLGEWLNSVIAEQAAEQGLDPEEIGELLVGPQCDSVRRRDEHWRTDALKGITQVDLGQTLRTSGLLEIAGKGIFLNDSNPLPAAVGSREQGNRDGYVNWQNAAETPGADRKSTRLNSSHRT